MDINQQKTNNNADSVSVKSRDRTSVTSLSKGQSVTGRIINGFEVRHIHWWPTFAEDRESGIMKPTWRTSYVDGNIRSPLDVLADVDKALQAMYMKMAGGNPKDANSLLTKKPVYEFAWISRDPKKEGKVEILEANWSVASAIDTLRTKTHPSQDKLKKLFYGLPYMYDICITKGQNAKTGRPEYTVVPVQCTMEGKIDIKYIDENKYPFPNKEQFFSPEDLNAIQSCQWELNEQDKPISITELIERLKTFPIDLSRRVKNDPGRFIFFRTKEELLALQAVMESEGVQYMVPHPNDLVAIPEKSGEKTLAAQIISNPQNRRLELTNAPNTNKESLPTANTGVSNNQNPTANTNVNNTQNQAYNTPNFNPAPVVGGPVPTNETQTDQNQISHANPVSQPANNTQNVGTPYITPNNTPNPQNTVSNMGVNTNPQPNNIVPNVATPISPVNTGNNTVQNNMGNTQPQGGNTPQNNQTVPKSPNAGPGTLSGNASSGMTDEPVW